MKISCCSMLHYLFGSQLAVVKSMNLWIHFKFKWYIYLTFFLFCILFFLHVGLTYILIYQKVYIGRVQLLFVPKRERMWKATTVLLASSCISSNCMRFILHADAYKFHANIIRRRIHTHIFLNNITKDKNMKMLLSKRGVLCFVDKVKVYEMNIKMTNLMLKPWCAKTMGKQYNLWSGVLGWMRAWAN